MAEKVAAGRTRWTRFAAALGVGAIGAGVLMVGLSQGAIAASFAVAGQSFQVTATGVEGQGFTQFGGVDSGSGADRAIAVNGFKSATIQDFCLSAVSPVPLFDQPITIKLSAPGKGVSAENLVLGLDKLAGDLAVTNADIGVNAGGLSAGTRKGADGGFGLTSATARLGALRANTWSTAASTLRINGLTASVVWGRNGQC